MSYPARKFGVKRGDTIEQAKKKCPSLIAGHVEYLSVDGAGSPDVSKAKVSLSRYRQASCRVAAAVARAATSDIAVERASIDEFYLQIPLDWAGDPEAAACKLAELVRATIRRDTGYTSSCGIAPTRLLAKLASSRNKPDKQTLATLDDVPRLWAETRLVTINGFRGERGKAVLAALGLDDQASASLVLARLLVYSGGDQTSAWARRVLTSADDGSVITPNLVPKSLQAAKSFGARGLDYASLEAWVKLLSSELADRAAQDLYDNRRVATRLTLSYRGPLRPDHRDSWLNDDRAKLTKDISRSRRITENLNARSIECAAMQLLQPMRKRPDVVCTRLILALSDFVQRPAYGIDTYFRSQVNAPAAYPQTLDPPRPPGVSSDSSTWVCSACTLHNDARHLACLVCRTPRIAAADQSEHNERPRTWICAACTLHNEAGAAKCAVCESYRPLGRQPTKKQRRDAPMPSGDIRRHLATAPA